MVVKKTEYKVELRGIPERDGLYGIVRFQSNRIGASFAGMSGFFEYDRRSIKMFDDSLFFYGTYKELLRSVRTVPKFLKKLYSSNINLEGGLGFRRGLKGVPISRYEMISPSLFNYQPWECRAKFLNEVVEVVKNNLVDRVTKLVREKYLCDDSKLRKKFNVLFRKFPVKFKESAAERGEYFRLPARLSGKIFEDFSKPVVVEEPLGLLPSWALEIVEKYKV